MTEPTDAPVTDEWLAAQRFDAALTDDQYRQILTRLDDPARRAPLRAAVALLARSSEDVLSRSVREPIESATLYLEMIECVGDRIRAHQSEIEMMESAALRMHVLMGHLMVLVPDDDAGTDS